MLSAELLGSNDKQIRHPPQNVYARVYVATCKRGFEFVDERLPRRAGAGAAVELNVRSIHEVALSKSGGIFNPMTTVDFFEVDLGKRTGPLEQVALQ